MKIAILFLAGAVIAVPAVFAQQPTLKTAAVDYALDGVTMEGYVAYDDAKKGAQPGVLIVHDWMGLGQFSKDKAGELAKLGYVAFAADIYGKGVRAKDAGEAAKLAGFFKDDRKLLRARVRAAFDKLAAMPQVDAKKIVVMGYCFGGTTALELARSGAPVAGTVSFHGGLGTPTPEDAKNIKGPVLVLHGDDDPFVPPAEVAAFKEEMKKGNVKMEFVGYKGAVHSFTNPAAGNDNSKGAAYNADADKQSWGAFQKFLKGVF
ncbi:MAG TPA: dienelactone hydrolase family protein [Gemmataceae bacterium]|nr:dienelactone hydrolase family protein [Gemmataceae bacterium]